MNPKKILVVDDNAIVLKTLSFKLTAAGYEVATATDGSEAVSFVRKAHPDLIIMDISFPPDVGHGGGVPWDGFLIMDWIKRVNEAQGIPFVVITGSEASEFKNRALAAGAASFMHKPIQHDELLAVIRGLLEERSANAHA